MRLLLGSQLHPYSQAGARHQILGKLIEVGWWLPGARDAIELMRLLEAYRLDKDAIAEAIKAQRALAHGLEPSRARPGRLAQGFSGA